MTDFDTTPGATPARPQPVGPTRAECAALHEVELGIERLHRAHGHLVAFHHNIGRSMNHLDEAEWRLRACGYERIADGLRDEYLPRGVLAGADHEGVTAGRWSYDVLEDFQGAFFDDLVDFGAEVVDAVADGQRHTHERRQERAWKARVGRP